MRNAFIGAILGLAAMLCFSSVASAQTAQSQPKQANEARSPWKYYPMDRSIGDGGPAPKRDLTGTWAGPGSGANVPRGTNNENPTAPPLTASGKRSEEHTSELQSRSDLVCRLLLEKKKKQMSASVNRMLQEQNPDDSLHPLYTT